MKSEAQTKKRVVVYWSRRDFRLHDNPALHKVISEAKKEDEDVEIFFLPIFVLENYMLNAETSFQFGYPSRYFLSKALPIFTNNFENFLLLTGQAASEIIKFEKKIKQKLGANTEVEVYANEDVYPDFYKQIQKLRKNNISIKVLDDQMTVNKETVSGSGTHYSIFTPFKKAVWNQFLLAPVLEKPNFNNLKYLPKEILDVVENRVEKIDFDNLWKLFSKNRKFEVADYESRKQVTIDIDKLDLVKPDYTSWYFDEKGAEQKLNDFIKNFVQDYKINRDSLENDVGTGKTSKLSLALAWGLLSARQIKQKIQEKFDEDFLDPEWNNGKYIENNSGVITFLSELIWRDFYKYILYHKPDLMHTEFQERFRNKIEWESGEKAVEIFTKWIKGETGYPIVDAAMTQLAKTGWMHNRSRMIVSSILTKNLGIDWRWGQEYFRAMLIDLDEASNNGGWQWGSSVGADPKPIRIFNPHLQAENYDTKNVYQNFWLSQKPNGDKYLFEVHEIIAHKEARKKAMQRYGLGQNYSARDY